MKTLKSVKTLASLVTIMAFMSFMCGGVSFSDTIDDRRQDDTFEFGSGYLVIDAGKDVHREANQDTVDMKNTAEAIMENQHGDREVAKLDLKGPKGGAESPTQTTQGDTGGTDNLLPVEEPEILPEPILEFLNEQEGNVIEYKAAFVDGKYTILWQEEDTANSRILVKMQVFDIAGNTVGDGYILTEERAVRDAGIYDIAVSSNGNTFVFWKEKVGDFWSVRTQLFNSSGSKISQQYVLNGDRIAYSTDMIKAVNLSDGSFGIFWEEENEEGKHFLRMQNFDQTSGGKIGNENLLSEDFVEYLAHEGYDNDTYGFNAEPLPNGNIAVFWREKYPNSDDFYFLKMQMFDINGSTTGEEVVLTGKRTATSAFVSNVVLLSSGNIAVVWLEREYNKKYAWAWNHKGVIDFIRLQMFDVNGQRIGNEFVISEDCATLKSKVVEITELSNGYLAVVYQGHRRKGAIHSYVTEPKMRLFDQNGNQIGEEYEFGTESLDRIRRVRVNDIVVLENGNIAVFWHRMREWGYWIGLKVIAPNGEEIKNEVLISTNTTEHDARISVLPGGNLAVFWVDSLGIGICTLRMKVLDQNGNEVADNTVEQVSWLKGGGGTYEHGMVIDSIVSLPDGKTAVFWYETPAWWKTRRLKMQIFGQDGEKIGPAYLISNSLPLAGESINAKTLSNGNILVVWKEDVNGRPVLLTKAFNQDGDAINNSYCLTGNRELTDVNVFNTIIFGGESVAIFWEEKDTAGKRSLKLQVFGKNGNIKGGEKTLTGNQTASVNNVLALSDGTVAVSWSESEGGQEQAHMQIFDSEGDSKTWTAPAIPVKGIIGSPDTGSEKDIFRYIWRLMSRTPTNYSQDNIKSKGDSARPIISGRDTGRVSREPTGNKFAFFDFNEYLMFRNPEELAGELREALKSYVSWESLNAAVVEKPTLEDMIKALEEMKDKSEFEESFLEIARNLEEEKDLLDKGMFEEFERAVFLAIIANDMKDLLKEGDFTGMLKAYNDLVTAHSELYNNFLNKTDETYKRLEGILGIDLENTTLPDKYLYVNNMSINAKRKVIIDLAIETLKGKEKADLKPNEKEALAIYESVLTPIREAYIRNLEKMLEIFVVSVRKKIGAGYTEGSKNETS